MSFWSQQNSEPLRQYRWWIVFGGANGNDLSDIRYALKKIDKPKAKIGSVQHKYLNHYFNYPGRLEWEDINMTFASITNPSAARYLVNVLKNSGYGVPPSDTNNNNKESDVATLGKLKFQKNIGNFTIQQLDPDGKSQEEWTIHNPFFTSVQFGALDYSSEEIVEITCTVKYDWAELHDIADAEDGADPVYPGQK